MSDDVYREVEMKFTGGIRSFVELLDGLDAARVRSASEDSALAVHGWTYYVRDTVVGAIALVRNGLVMPAIPLARVAWEHAAAVYLSRSSPSFQDMIMQEFESRNRSFALVAAESGLLEDDDPDVLDAKRSKVRGVKEVGDAKTLFGLMDPSAQAYGRYRLFSRYVHLSPDTITAYFCDEDGDKVRVRTAHPTAEVRLATVQMLGESLSVAASTYLDLIRTKPYKTRVRAIAKASDLPVVPDVNRHWSDLAREYQVAINKEPGPAVR